MTLTWLIEANVYGIESDALQNAIRQQGMQVRVVKPNLSALPPRDLLGAEDLAHDGWVIFLGTLTVMAHIQRTRRWKPGGWCSFGALSCSTYYAHFGPLLLNQAYSLLPCAEAIRHAKRLVETYGEAGKVFMRPDGVRKVFKGSVVRAHELEQTLSSACHDPTELVLIAKPQEVHREWRLVIANGAVVAASQYLERGQEARSAGCPDAVRAFAEGALSQVAWRPDPLFMLDVCEGPEGLRVVELNSFSCSGLYACDVPTVISAATECARKLW